MEHHLVGQETTGAGGLAMALRTVPIALEQARIIERVAPDAWLINLYQSGGIDDASHRGAHQFAGDWYLRYAERAFSSDRARAWRIA
ncbi:MAG: hypothetical protein WKF84_03750 [Pyrinomonadaceae bacterium]